MLAYAPLYPFPKEEKWVFMIGDPLLNAVFVRTEVPLLEAEQAGFAARARSVPSAAAPRPELVDLTAGAIEAAPG